MANQSTYPTTLDSDPTDKVVGDVVPSDDWNTYLDALVNLETKVGVDNTTVSASIDYLTTSVSAYDPGHRHTGIYTSAGTMIISGKGGEIYFEHENWQIEGANFKWPSSAASGTYTAQMLQNNDGQLVNWNLHQTSFKALDSSVSGISSTSVGGVIMGANETWWFEATVLIDGAVATDFNFFWAGPAGYNCTWGSLLLWTDQVVGSGGTPTPLLTSADSQTRGATGTDSIQLINFLAFLTTSSTSGTAILYVAQATTGTSLTTVRSGTNSKAKRLL